MNDKLQRRLPYPKLQRAFAMLGKNVPSLLKMSFRVCHLISYGKFLTMILDDGKFPPPAPRRLSRDPSLRGRVRSTGDLDLFLPCLLIYDTDTAPLYFYSLYFTLQEKEVPYKTLHYI